MQNENSPSWGLLLFLSYKIEGCFAPLEWAVLAPQRCGIFNNDNLLNDFFEEPVFEGGGTCVDFEFYVEGDVGGVGDAAFILTGFEIIEDGFAIGTGGGGNGCAAFFLEGAYGIGNGQVGAEFFGGEF